MAMTLDGSNGVTFNDASLQGAAASPFGLKNRIINGAMQVWQRGTSFTNVANGTFTVDRFSTTTSGINLTVTQDTLVPSVAFKYSLKAVPASNATASECGIRQFIEQQNIFDFAGQTVTGSAWVYCSKSSVKFRLGTQNATGGTDVLQNVSVTAATWTRITFSFSSFSAVTAWTSTPNASGGYLDIGFADNTALTTSDYLYITGVQLEVGSTATPFERRMYGQELALCQRYYYKMKGVGADTTMFANGFCNTTTRSFYMVTFPTQLRTAPSALETTGTAGDYYNYSSAGALTCTVAPTFQDAENCSSRFYADVASGQTAGGSVILRSKSASAYLAWSAEL
jgi:hypothetical protein